MVCPPAEWCSAGSATRVSGVRAARPLFAQPGAAPMPGLLPGGVGASDERCRAASVLVSAVVALLRMTARGPRKPRNGAIVRNQEIWQTAIPIGPDTIAACYLLNAGRKLFVTFEQGHLTVRVLRSLVCPCGHHSICWTIYRHERIDESLRQRPGSTRNAIARRSPPAARVPGNLLSRGCRHTYPHAGLFCVMEPRPTGQVPTLGLVPKRHDHLRA